MSSYYYDNNNNIYYSRPPSGEEEEEEDSFLHNDDVNDDDVIETTTRSEDDHDRFHHFLSSSSTSHSQQQQQQHFQKRRRSIHSPLSKRSVSSSFPTMLTESFLDDGGDYRVPRTMLLSTTTTRKQSMDPSPRRRNREDGTTMATTMLDKNSLYVHPSSTTTTTTPRRERMDDYWGIHQQQDFYPSLDDSEKRIFQTRRRRRRRRQDLPLMRNKNDYYPSIPEFPHTIEQVADGAAETIVFSLMQQQQKQQSSQQQQQQQPRIGKEQESTMTATTTAVVDTNNDANDDEYDNFDPHLLINSWDQNWQDRRPVRQVSDSGRMGIEIDGILPSVRTVLQDIPATRTSTSRAVSLCLAHKLATHMAWSTTTTTTGTSRSSSTSTTNSTTMTREKKKKEEEDDNNNNDDNDDMGAMDSHETKGSGPVPVVVYFNTIKQALAASEELAILKRLEHHHKVGTTPSSSSSSSSSYDSVSILSLGPNTTLPNVLTQDSLGYGNDYYSRTSRRSISTEKKRNIRRSWLNKGITDPSRGIILVVQPTDVNQEYRPPSPSIGTLSHLQRLVAHAAVFAIPVVVISPRFLEQIMDSSSCSCDGGRGSSVSSGWDQSGYQQSSSFGGKEPPNGPTPWILRDFVPPIYSWVGDVTKLPRHGHHHSKQEQQHQESLRNDHDFSYMAIYMVQSIRHRQRAWHIFARRRWYDGRGLQKRRTRINDMSSSSSSSLSQPQQQHDDIPSRKGSHYYDDDYKYLASTKCGAGRPTRNICFLIWQKFALDSSSSSSYFSK